MPMLKTDTISNHLLLQNCNANIYGKLQLIFMENL